MNLKNNCDFVNMLHKHTNVFKQKSEMLFDYTDLISSFSSININELKRKENMVIWQKKFLYVLTENIRKLLDERLNYIGYDLNEKKFRKRVRCTFWRRD